MLKEQAKLFWIGIPILFIVGSLFHFLYGLFGELFIIGLIAPVNESIFEHTKLFSVPAALWYALVYLFRRDTLNADLWFTAALISISAHIASMLFLYYFYTGAFALKSVALDITTFFVAVTLGQVIGLHYYKHGKGLNHRLALLLTLAILIVSALLTVAPPRLPMFLDPVTNTYGIFGGSAA